MYCYMYGQCYDVSWNDYINVIALSALGFKVFHEVRVFL